MILGIVSNCWRSQLAEGVPLELLVAKAQREGYRAIELRQGCLGEFETAGEFVPIAERLANLPVEFPYNLFNIALAFPFFDPAFGPDSHLFLAGVDAATALKGWFNRHLRFVDVTSEQKQIELRDRNAITQNLVRLARSMAERDAVLSVENGKQEWRVIHELIQAVRRELGADDPQLRLCYDACNLLQATDRPDAKQVVENLKASDLAMIHFKQARNGQPQFTVCKGDIDWRHQLNCLERAGFNGPALFELPPHERIWDHLRESRQYLGGLGLKLN